MKNTAMDMTEGNLWKKILLFSLPLMMSNLLQVLFNMADVAVVGRFAGAEALGSVGSTTTLLTIPTWLLVGLSGGVTVIVARYFGARDRDALKKTVHTAFLCCLMTGIGIAVAGIAGARVLLRLLKTKELLMDGAVKYLAIFLLGTPAMAVYNFGNAVYSAVGNTRRPLAILSCAGVVNVALNLFFVIVCRMSVVGVALASVLSQYLSAGLILFSLCRVREDWGLKLREVRISPPHAKQILALGIPSALQTSIFGFANLFIQMGVNSFSWEMVAGNAAAANSDALVYDVMAAFYTACGSFMGQNYGAGRAERVKKTFRICLMYSFTVGAILGLSLVAAGPRFLGLFASDPQVIECGMERLRIMGFSYAISAFMDNTIAGSRALGHSVVPMIIVMLGSVLFRIIWIYTVFAWFRTIPSLYLLYVCSWVITAIAEAIYYRRIFRRLVLRAPASA